MEPGEAVLTIVGIMGNEWRLVLIRILGPKN